MVKYRFRCATHGVGGAVALGRVVRVVEQRVDRLVALQIDDAQELAAPHELAVAAARVDHLTVDRLRSIALTFD